MKVALLSRAAHPLHGPGGLERAVYHLARNLQARGVQTVLFTRPASHTARFPGEVVTVRYARWPAGAHGRILDRTLHYPAFALRLGEAVAARVRAGEIDVVHAQGLTALGYGRLRRRDSSLTAPLLMNPQGLEEHKAAGLKRLALVRLRRLSCEAARSADRVIATDAASLDEVRRHLGVATERIAVLPNGIDPEEIRAATPDDPAEVVHQAWPELDGARPLLLSVGRLVAYKGFRDVLEALRRLAADGALPPRWAWVVVGEGPLSGSLRRHSAGALSSHVRLVGHAPENLLHALYARADLFVHATRYEGSSLVTLEAMAHGLAVVASRAGGIPDKVSADSGRLVEPGDVPALAAALAELVADPDLARRLGERGRQRARGEFAWPALAARTEALYRELLLAGR